MGKRKTCSVCGLQGHNKRTCAGAVAVIPPRVETILTGKTPYVVNVITGERTPIPERYQEGDGWVNYLEGLYA